MHCVPSSHPCTRTSHSASWGLVLFPTLLSPRTLLPSFSTGLAPPTSVASEACPCVAGGQHLASPASGTLVWNWRTRAVVDSHIGKQGPQTPASPASGKSGSPPERPTAISVAIVWQKLRHSSTCPHYELDSLILHGVSCEALSVFNLPKLLMR